MNAQEAVRRINANVGAYWEGRIDYPAFALRSQALWDEIEAGGLVEEVEALLSEARRQPAEVIESVLGERS